MVSALPCVCPVSHPCTLHIGPVSAIVRHAYTAALYALTDLTAETWPISKMISMIWLSTLTRSVNEISKSALPIVVQHRYFHGIGLLNFGMQIRRLGVLQRTVSETTPMHASLPVSRHGCGISCLSRVACRMPQIPLEHTNSADTWLSRYRTQSTATRTTSSSIVMSFSQSVSASNAVPIITDEADDVRHRTRWALLTIAEL